MTVLKSNKKIEEKLISCFKNGKNLVKFDPSTEKYQKFAPWLVLSGNFWSKKLSFMTLESDAKFEEKLSCGLEKNRHLSNFYQSTWESQNRDFDGILFSKTENIWASNLQGSCVMKMKNDAKLEEELTGNFKIDIRTLINFDPSTWKSQIFAL